MRRRSNSASGLPANVRAWLEGSKSCGLFRFQSTDVLEAIWNEHGSASMFWRRGLLLPITREKLEEHESDWIDSAESDEYGAASYFVHKFYSDEEKAELAKRGKATWQPGSRRPEAI